LSALKAIAPNSAITPPPMFILHSSCNDYLKFPLPPQGLFWHHFRILIEPDPIYPTPKQFFKIDDN